MPRPGSLRQLKRLTGRIMSQQLDRGKLLWEMWFVEGVEGGRFAVITKAHHCMFDGVSGVDLLAALMTADPERSAGEHHPWVPRPTPTAADLLLDEVGRRAGLPLQILRGTGAALSAPLQTLAGLKDAAEGLVETLTAGLTPASPADSPN